MPGSMEKRRSVSDVNGKKKNRINTDFVEIYQFGCLVTTFIIIYMALLRVRKSASYFSLDIHSLYYPPFQKESEFRRYFSGLSSGEKVSPSLIAARIIATVRKPINMRKQHMVLGTLSLLSQKKLSCPDVLGNYIKKPHGCNFYSNRLCSENDYSIECMIIWDDQRNFRGSDETLVIEGRCG